MRDDAELLRCYAIDHSQEAFAELVRRHLGLVYNAALRQVGGDTHLAQDVAQAVFTDLARKAAALAGHRVLAGWLYTSTRYAAVQVVRGERRRRKREEEALRMKEVELGASGEMSPEWERLRPVIDEALHGLGERDREAVLLRFFEELPFAEIGRALAISEDAARMRVDRALTKLRDALMRRGVASTTAALGIVLSNPAWASVPAGVASQVVAGALAGATTASGAGMAATFMGMTKLQVGLAGVIIAGGAAGLLVQRNAHADLAADYSRVRVEENAQENRAEEDRRRAQAAVEARELRKDDVAFARLEEEAESLKRELAANLAARERLRKAAAGDSRNEPVLKMSEVDVMPKALKRSPPKYPADLRAVGIEGEAVVSFVVGADGKVRNVEAVKTTHEAVAKVSVDAVQEWVFEAARKGNVPVNVQMVVPIVFALHEEDGRANTWF